MRLTTPDQYLDSLPADHRATMLAVHAAIRKAVPKLTPEMMMGMGFSPIIGYGKFHSVKGDRAVAAWLRNHPGQLGDIAKMNSRDRSSARLPGRPIRKRL